MEVHRDINAAQKVPKRAVAERVRGAALRDRTTASPEAVAPETSRREGRRLTAAKRFQTETLPQSALRSLRIVNSISPDGSSRQLSTALI
jgi:hypothetical protein